MDKIKHFIDLDLIKVITGVRRCGKSYMLNLIKEELLQRGVTEENIILINFESINYKYIRDGNELDKVVIDLTKDLKGKVYLFFDEIQDIPMWEKCINSYRVSLDCDIYITGSNSNMLSGELATYLTGRYVEIKMLPFSFKEFIYYKSDIMGLDLDINNLPAHIKYDFFKEYSKYGGFPFIASLNTDIKLEPLTDIYNSILYKDLLTRYEIRDVSLIERLFTYIVDNIGNVFSAKAISDYLVHEGIKVTNKTIYNYLCYFENASLISKVQREDLAGKKLLKINEKYYLTDHGFSQAILGEHNINKAKICENIVYLELLRRGYKVTIGKVNGYEIDFVARKANKKLYIQVSYLLASDETIEREFKPLLKIKDNYPKFVVSLDNFDFSQKGITHFNIIDFLLEDCY